MEGGGLLLEEVVIRLVSLERLLEVVFFFGARELADMLEDAVLAVGDDLACSDAVAENHVVVGLAGVGLAEFHVIN